MSEVVLSTVNGPQVVAPSMSRARELMAQFKGLFIADDPNPGYSEVDRRDGRHL